jgi:transposase InsO family protein
MMESFWSSMLIELLDCKRWKTTLELSNVIFDYIEISYDRQRRHSSLDFVLLVEFQAVKREKRTA